MTFYKSNLGSSGGSVQADINGYVPTEDTGPWELNYDHGSEQTHDDHGELTGYGEWWEGERFPEIKAAAIKARRTRNQKLVEAVKQQVRKV